MKTLPLGVAFAGMCLVMAGSADSRPAGPGQHAAVPEGARAIQPVRAASHALPPEDLEDLTEVVQRYCVRCHNDRTLRGNLSLEAFSVEEAAENPETAEKMIRKLRAEMMPPPGAARPPSDTLVALAEALESDIDAAAHDRRNLGERRLQRLSRAEYERVIRDLLALDVDASMWLPPDVLMQSFDNMAAAQGYSTTQLDAYLRAASDISRLAVGNPEAVSTTAKYANPDELSQHAWDRLPGAPFGTRGGMVLTHDFPADGEYVFQVETRWGSGNVTGTEDVVISIDGETVARLMLEHNGGREIPVIRTEPIFVRAGQHAVAAAFVDLIDGPYEDRFSPPEWSAAGPAGADYGATGLTHLSELMITGPSNVTGVSETASRAKVFSCRPSSAAEERPCAESILRDLATHAYRRPATEQDLTDLMAFYDEGAAEEGFEMGVRTGLQAVLVSPYFLFRVERAPDGATAARGARLSDVELATRLSFFLWGQGPDDELLRVASRGSLSEPAVLEQQVQRMLEDPRSEALATRFFHLWLRLQDVETVWPDASMYPSFSKQLAQSMITETEMLFEHLVREDRSLLELFTADYTFLNERLARHYGIEGVSGPEFRMVKYPNAQRRGVFGHGSVLKLTSMADRTSPVLRGKWVMEVLMGTPPPPPPPNVPTLEESPGADAGRRLTTRERMEVHRSNPACTSCHSFIDPIGLALDNFDAVGAWRVRENMVPLDTRGTFYDGTSISTPPELVEVLMKRPIPLVRNFTERMLSYAIGRPIEYFDQPTVRAIARAAAANDYRMSSLIMGVVKSDVFQMSQAPTTTD